MPSFNSKFSGGGAAVRATTITADDLEIDSGTLSIDETNNRVGVGLTTPKTALTVEGPVTLKEQANADGDTAAYGQLWVKNATPNQLYFTTDAGDDVQITSGTGLVGSGSAADDITAGDAAVNLTTTSGNITIDAQEGDADIIFKGTDSASDITALTLDMSEAGAALFNAAVTVGTDLTVTGGDVSYGNGQDATLAVADTSSGTDGRDLTISAGSAPTGSANQNGGDLILKSGGGDGTGTSMIAFHTKVNGTDAAAERMRIHTDGNVGIGTSAPSQILQVASAAPIVVVQNTTDEHTDGGAESKVLFGDHAGNALSMIEGAHIGSSDDAKGQFKVSTNNGSGTQLAMSIDDSQNTVLSGDLSISGGDTTLGTAGNTTATTISTITNTGTTVGKSLTIAAGSTTTGANNLNGGDLVLKSGDGDGNGTSGIQFHTKISGVDAAAERMRINTNGNVVINGSTAHAASLALDGATAAVALKEMANAPADTAAFGQLWVKTATPNELYFTTDAGNDIQITSGTSTAGGGSVTANDASLILATRVFS